MLSKSSAPNVVFAMSSTYKVYLPLSRILLSMLISLSLLTLLSLLSLPFVPLFLASCSILPPPSFLSSLSSLAPYSLLSSVCTTHIVFPLPIAFQIPSFCIHYVMLLCALVLWLAPDTWRFHRQLSTVFLPSNPCVIVTSVHYPLPLIGSLQRLAVSTFVSVSVSLSLHIDLLAKRIVVDIIMS